MPIQSFFLPQWKWFVDYATIGHRIWLAWDENIIDVHVLESGEQFLHCRVTNRTDNDVVIITIFYGASEVIDRRALWTTLETMAQQCTDDPPRLNEVCGILGDIPVFRQQRRNKGDLTLNVQLAKGSLEEAQNLVSSDRQNELFLFLEHCCRLVYAKAAKLEQIMLQQRAKMQWMKGGDQRSRIFFRKIAQRRAVRRILQINDENGTTHTESSEVVHEFVSYNQNLLGGNRRRLLMDINYLRPWAMLILSNEEASHLFLPFSPEDVKQAIFDIAEDKAPGPDGFSSGFFKAAWPVVGTEVTRAVLDFFTRGKLLKQVNSTLLALIPKVHTPPMSVNDFRPISCCNVLYKVITKLLVQRLSMVLDKLISPCQAAFIPGRSIGDNIMLAQEMFTGYNQIRLPPRCELKVDIRKAYDTVEWDFLVAVLQFFNFPTTFIRWIEECITTATFSIGLNGKPHGFFNGARGLRQGDPLSPYLFVLVMEVLHLGFLQLIEQDMQFTYHWKCELARVFQLGFADDLLLFCRADMDSVRVFKMGLDRAVIKEVEKRLRTFLWKGTSMTGYATVPWKDVCKPEEGGLGIKDIGILNRALMTKKLCDVIRCDRTSIWAEWLQHGRLRNNSIWTVGEQGGSWGWRKLLRMRSYIQPMVELHIGDGRTFYLWKDPWHQLGPLLPRFPRGPYLLGLEDSTKLSSVIDGGQWHWPLITDLECLQITKSYRQPIDHGSYILVGVFFVTRRQWRRIPTFSSDAVSVDYALRLFGGLFESLGPTGNGQGTSNGQRKNVEGSILLMQPIEHYLDHSSTIYGEKET
ncbi:UNVERIFIED_CONTAM: putative mitochondrial protein [Sesamum indicum]